MNRTALATGLIGAVVGAVAVLMILLATGNLFPQAEVVTVPTYCHVPIEDSDISLFCTYEHGAWVPR